MAGASPLPGRNGLLPSRMLWAGQLPSGPRAHREQEIRKPFVLGKQHYSFYHHLQNNPSLKGINIWAKGFENKGFYQRRGGGSSLLP